MDIFREYGLIAIRETYHFCQKSLQCRDFEIPRFRNPYILRVSIYSYRARYEAHFRMRLHSYYPHTMFMGPVYPLSPCIA